MRVNTRPCPFVELFLVCSIARCQTLEPANVALALHSRTSFNQVSVVTNDDLESCHCAHEAVVRHFVQASTTSDPGGETCRSRRVPHLSEWSLSWFWFNWSPIADSERASRKSRVLSANSLALDGYAYQHKNGICTRE